MTGLNGQTSTLIDVIGPGGPSSGTILTGGTSLQTPSHTTLLPSSHPRGSTVSVSNSAIATAQSSNTQSTDQPVLSSTLSSSLTGQSSNPLTNTTILPSSSTGVSSPQTSITTSPASGAQSTTLPVSPGSSIPSASSGSSGTAQTPSSQTPGQSTSSGIFSSSITPGPTTTKPSSAPGSTSTGPGGWTTSDIIVTATDGHTTDVEYTATSVTYSSTPSGGGGVLAIPTVAWACTGPLCDPACLIPLLCPGGGGGGGGGGGFPAATPPTDPPSPDPNDPDPTNNPSNSPTDSASATSTPPTSTPISSATTLVTTTASSGCTGYTLPPASDITWYTDQPADSVTGTAVTVFPSGFNPTASVSATSILSTAPTTSTPVSTSIAPTTTATTSVSTTQTAGTTTEVSGFPPTGSPSCVADGPSLPRDDIAGKVDPFCESIDGKSLSYENFNLNDTSSWDGANEAIFGLGLVLNWENFCDGASTIKGDDCKTTFNSILDGCAPFTADTSNDLQKFGGSQTGERCVAYNVQLINGNVFEPAKAPLPPAVSRRWRRRISWR
ncbi:MAG: hypothetical protein HETSPECPRED_005369 [Heterodermia speciosa]|uniref:Uncharacterized protein n=1 Tax=Heterodermia speciosa TaxID=116794 RepID=A0A8H3ID22_9LECA|nr:MAG: hypothetical protein HETSPECPRED_005369 [Heterodermia speciosa]